MSSCRINVSKQYKALNYYAYLHQHVKRLRRVCIDEMEPSKLPLFVLVPRYPQ